MERRSFITHSRKNSRKKNERKAIGMNMKIFMNMLLYSFPSASVLFIQTP